MAVELPPIVASQAPELASFEERWAAWLAKGEAHDLAVRRKLAIGVPALVVAAAVVFAFLGR
jgi:hypothetical protein